MKKTVLRILAVALLPLLFVLCGAPLLAEPAERASLAPLMGIPVAFALFPEARGRRTAALLGGLALVAFAGALAFHMRLAAPYGMAVRPAEVGVTALFYLGSLTLILGVYALAKRTAGLRVAIPLALALAVVHIPVKLLVHWPKVWADTGADTVGGPREDVFLTTRDGFRLRGSYFPSSKAGRSPAVIVAHGVGAEHRMFFSSYARAIHRLGYACLLFDFRGHGRSDGHLVTYGLREREDVRTALAWLKARPDVDPARIAIAGHSMGAAIAIVAAADLPEIRAVLADAPFDDIRAVAARRMGRGVLPEFLGRALVWCSFGALRLESGLDLRPPAPIERIAALSPRPLLLIHGTADRSTFVESSRRLYAAAWEPRALAVFEGLDHDRMTKPLPAAYQERFETFLREALGDPELTTPPRR